MIDVIKSIIDLITEFINRLYNIEIDLIPNTNIKLGTLVLAFVFFVFTIYFILKMLGIIDKGGE